jgi:DNA polymerase-1
MGVNALKQNLGPKVSREEASRFLSEYFRNFAGLSRWIDHVKRDATRLGYTETLFGRRRYFPMLKSPLPQMRAQAERMAVNAPMQGTQSDIIKLAMVEADKLIEKNGWQKEAKLLLQVHDELVYEVSEKESEEIAQAIRHAMESVAPIDKLSGVPILAEAAIGKHWGDMKKLKR